MFNYCIRQSSATYLSSLSLSLSLSHTHTHTHTIELLANEWLTRTYLIYPHSLLLSRFKVDRETLKQQVRNTALTKKVHLMLFFYFRLLLLMAVVSYVIKKY